MAEKLCHTSLLIYKDILVNALRIEKIWKETKSIQFNQQYDVFDTLLKLLWYIFIIRKFPKRVIFFPPQ